jgi:hypothetical protein
MMSTSSPVCYPPSGGGRAQLGAAPCRSLSFLAPQDEVRYQRGEEEDEQHGVIRRCAPPSLGYGATTNVTGSATRTLKYPPTE